MATKAYLLSEQDVQRLQESINETRRQFRNVRGRISEPSSEAAWQQPTAPSMNLVVTPNGIPAALTNASGYIQPGVDYQCQVQTLIPNNGVTILSAAIDPITVYNVWNDDIPVDAQIFVTRTPFGYWMAINWVDVLLPIKEKLESCCPNNRWPKRCWPKHRRWGCGC